MESLPRHVQGQDLIRVPVWHAREGCPVLRITVSVIGRLALHFGAAEALKPFLSSADMCSIGSSRPCCLEMPLLTTLLQLVDVCQGHYHSGIAPGGLLLPRPPLWR